MSLNDTNQAKAPGKPRPLVLGLERIGLISLRFPLLVGLAALALLVTAVFGIARIKVNDSLSHRDISGAFRTACGTMRADEFAVKPKRSYRSEVTMTGLASLCPSRALWEVRA